MIFTRYPNPKVGPEYLVELVNCLAEQPAWIIDRVADRRMGITAQHPTFLPTVGEIVEMIKKLELVATQSAAANRRRTEYTALPMGAYRRPHGKYQPFPKLWEAFATEEATVERLNTGLPFESLFDASKMLATRGIEAARAIIWRGDETLSPTFPRQDESEAA